MADSEKMAGLLEATGFRPTEFENEADIIILNTCAVRENAENRIFENWAGLKT